MDRSKAEAAEIGLIGALLMGAAESFRLVDFAGLKPHHFAEERGRIAFECMIGMHAEKEPVEIVSVFEKLKHLRLDEKAGGVEFLEHCYDKAVSPENAEYYLGVVMEAARLRECAEIARRADREVEQGDTDSEVIAAEAARRFTAVAEGAVPEREASNKELMLEFVKQCRAAWDGTGKPAIGLPVLWDRMTELTCGLETGVTVLAGRPSAGKTTLEDQIADILTAQGIGVLRFCLDMSREQLLQRAVARNAGRSLPKLKWGFAGEEGLALAEEAVEMLADRPNYIAHERDIEGIERRARAMKARHPEIRLITIDFIQKIEVAGLGTAQANRNLAIGWIMTRLKALSIQMGIPVLALSQLRRLAPNEREKPPVLEDLRDSGEIEQDASKVWFVYPDAKQNKDWEEEDPGSTERKRAVWFSQAKYQNGALGSLRFVLLPKYFKFLPANEYFDEDAEAAAGTPRRKHGKEEGEPAVEEQEPLEVDDGLGMFDEGE